jgi:hypothetical protein
MARHLVKLSAGKQVVHWMRGDRYDLKYHRDNQSVEEAAPTYEASGGNPQESAPWESSTK